VCEGLRLNDTFIEQLLYNIYNISDIDIAYAASRITENIKQ